jgi:hypothetical protein
MTYQGETKMVKVQEGTSVLEAAEQVSAETNRSNRDRLVVWFDGC